jgi:hypothetical protein
LTLPPSRRAHSFGLKARDQLCGAGPFAGQAFKVYLVDNSGVGLVCRRALQDPAVDTEEAESLIE